MKVDRFHLSSWLPFIILAWMHGIQADSLRNIGEWPPSSSPELQRIVDRAIVQTVEQFRERQVAPGELALTVIDLTDPEQLQLGHHRGSEQIYPASVIKLFYMVAVHQWLAEGKLEETDELRRAMADMIQKSYNEATHYIVDLLTDTTSGPELSEADLEEWYRKRNGVNRYFHSLGYTRVNANRKPWCEGPYGREIQSIRQHAPNHRNWLTTDETARLLLEIVRGQVVNADCCQEMLALMERDTSAAGGAQATGFMARGLPSGAKLWSKAGWTSQTRHDAGYLELPDGGKLILVIFTENHASETELLPALTRNVLTGIGQDGGGTAQTPN